MNATPQKRALKNYRKRLAQRGLARFEVLGLDTDRELIRSLARRLADESADGARIRATVRRTVEDLVEAFGVECGEGLPRQPLGLGDVPVPSHGGLGYAGRRRDLAVCERGGQDQANGIKLFHGGGLQLLERGRFVVENGALSNA